MTAVDTKAPITSFDRCDKCGAQAMVRATLIAGQLYFCGHHAREVGSTLINQSIEVYDPEGVFNYGKQSV
jgi:hypothetical protein